MVNSLSGVGYKPSVNFGATSMEKVTPEMLAAPQLFHVGSNGGNILYPGEQSEHKGSFLGGLVKTVVKLAVLAAVVVGVRKKFVKGSLEELNKAGSFGEKAKYHFAKIADNIEEYAVKAYKAVSDKVKNFRVKKPEETVKKAESEIKS